jgi:hypothetical protein
MERSETRERGAELTEYLSGDQTGLGTGSFPRISPATRASSGLHSEREAPIRIQHNAYANAKVLRSHWRRGIGRELAAAIDA